MITVDYLIELGYLGGWFAPRTPRRPLVPVRISAGERFQETRALVDSGADYSVFSSEFAEALGLELSAGRPVALLGLDGALHRGYVHPVAIRLLLAGGPWPAIRGRVIFRENHPSEVGNLLGRRDFFRALKIGFDERKQSLYLGLL